MRETGLFGSPAGHSPLSLASGQTITRAYDGRYYPSEISVSGGVFDWVYTEDGVGNVTAIDDRSATNADRSFAYQDYQYYLTCAAGPWSSGSTCPPGATNPLQWTYDKIGNRVTEAAPNHPTDTYLYAHVPFQPSPDWNSPKLSSVNEAGSIVRSYTFDAAGNETQVSAGANKIKFSPSDENKIATFARGLFSANLTYDGRGFLQQAFNASNSGYVQPDYDSQGRLMSLFRLPQSGGTPERHNVLYFAGRPIATWDKVGSTTATVTYLTTDPLGTPAFALNASGAKKWGGGFEPFGFDFQAPPNDAQSNGVFLRLPGQWYDTTWTNATMGADLYYNVNRWYQYQDGRYSQVDPPPLGSGFAPFGYVLDRPEFYSDPLGLAPKHGAAGGCPCGSDCPGGQWHAGVGSVSLYLVAGGWSWGTASYTCASNGFRLDTTFHCITVGLIAGFGGGGEADLPAPGACGCFYNDLLGPQEATTWSAAVVQGSSSGRCGVGDKPDDPVGTLGFAASPAIPFLKIGGGVGKTVCFHKPSMILPPKGPWWRN